MAIIILTAVIGAAAAFLVARGRETSDTRRPIRHAAGDGNGPR